MCVALPPRPIPLIPTTSGHRILWEEFSRWFSAAWSVQPVVDGGGANKRGIEGALSIPVLSMHTLGDLFVPFSMEQIYARRAAANGANALLVTRAIRDINHCGFNTTEMELGFADLVNWVSNSVKPAGDDILTPAVVANPNFGCNFTVGAHLLAPACQ